MTPAVRPWLFWTLLYATCVAAAMAVTPGLPEALGFTLPVLLACTGAAWLMRRRTATARRAAVVAIAAVLLAGAMTGTLGRGHDLDRQTAAAASLG